MIKWQPRHSHLERGRTYPGLSTCVFAFLIACLVLSILEANGQNGVPIWTNRYHGPVSGDSYATSLAVSGNGTVFVTGTSTGTNGFLPHGSSQDFATLAYSSAGVPLWTNRYSNHSGAGACAIAIDSTDHVFVTGSGTANVNAYQFYATLGYTAAGAPLWTNFWFEGSDSDSPSALVVDANDNLFVTGVAGEDTFHGEDIVTVGYTSAGLPLWTNRYNGPAGSDDASAAIATDKNGNVLVTGCSVETNGIDDIATIAYAHDGSVLWTNFYPSGVASALAVNNNGDVIVGGYAWNTNGRRNFATIAYSGEGAPLWTNRYHGPANSEDFVWGLAVGRNGNVFVTGYSCGGGATVAYSDGGEPLWTNRSQAIWQAVAVDCRNNVFVTGALTNSSTGSDLITAAYSAAGVPLWTNRYKGPGWNGYNEGLKITTDTAGNVLVAGQSPGLGSDYDYVTLKYSSSLQPWLAGWQNGAQLVLSWNDPAFSLQSAPSITGVFTNIPGCTSPFTNQFSTSQKYFRLNAN